MFILPYCQYWEYLIFDAWVDLIGMKMTENINNYYI